MKSQDKINDVKINCEYSTLVPITDLSPNPKNPNSHSKEQIERLALLIKNHGIRHPIVVSKRSNLIVAGHGRLEALKELGLKEAPVDYQDFDSDDLEYAFLVSDNAISDWSDLNFSEINANIGELGPDFDIDLLGIKDFNLDVSEKFEMQDELKDDMNKKFMIEVTFPNDMEMMDIHDDLVSRGYIVKIKK